MPGLPRLRIGLPLGSAVRADGGGRALPDRVASPARAPGHMAPRLRVPQAAGVAAGSHRGGGAAVSLREDRTEDADARPGLFPAGRKIGRDRAACALGGSAVFLQPDRQDVSRRARAAVSRGIPVRMHRQRDLRASERSHRAGAAKERLRSSDSGRTGLLRRVAPPRRPAQRCPAPGTAQHRRAGKWRLRRHYHQRRRLRVHIERVWRAAGGRSAICRQGARVRRRHARRDGVSGGPRRAAQAAGGDSGAGVSRDARRGHLLRQRGDL